MAGDITNRVRLGYWDAQGEKIPCRGCRSSLNSSYYWPTSSLLGHLYVDLHGHRCFPLCKDCTHELYKKILAENNTDHYIAMRQLCMLMNVYWDADLLEKILKSDRGYVLPDDYLMITVGTLRNKPKDQYVGRNFFKQLQEEASTVNPTGVVEGEEEEYTLTQADKDNRQAIVSVFLHDPFF